MWRAISRYFYYKMGKKLTRGAARSIGMGKLATVLGILGGIRMMRNHWHGERDNRWAHR